MIMKKPEIEVIRFKSADIVAASSGANTITLSGMGNAEGSDNRFTFGTYNFVGANYNTIKTGMADYFDAGFSNVDSRDVWFINGTKKARLTNLSTGGTATDGFNGTYDWNGPDTYTFTKRS